MLRSAAPRRITRVATARRALSTARPSVHVVYYSAYNHTLTLAESVAAGVEAGGCEAKIFRVRETLPEEVQKAVGRAPEREDHPVADAKTLEDADGLLFGLCSRFGGAPSQVKALLDSTGGQWVRGALAGKPAGLFFSTGTQGGGAGGTLALSFLSNLVHHGMVYVPLGYRVDLSRLDEVHGASPWGAGCFAGADGSRAVSDFEKEVAHAQGEEFAKTTLKLARK